MKGLCGVGLALEHITGPEKVTGQIKYALDVVPEGTIWGVTVRSPFPYARILSIDTSRARALPGVRAVITAADLPDRRFGRYVKDQPILARDVVRFAGEKVVAIAADDLDTAEEAATLVEIHYEELDPVVDTELAMRPDAPALHPNPELYDGWAPTGHPPNVQSHQHFEKGNVEEGFRAADVVVEGTYTTAAMHHAHIEPHACVVDTRPDGSCTIWSSNKMPFIVRRVLAPLVGVREEQIRVINLPVGGDFGAKACVMDEPVAYYLSKAAGRPVKIVMSTSEELAAANPRHGSRVSIRLGATRDGHLTAMQVRAVFDGGAYLSYKPTPILPGLRSVGGPYRIPHSAVDGYIVYTNTMPRGYMRAPGGHQVTFPFESALDELAGRLGIEPIEIRRRNAILDGELSALGEEWIGVKFVETLERAVSAFEAGRDAPDVTDLRARVERGESPYRIGVGIGACQKEIGGAISNATVEVDAAGHVTVISGLVDPGTGAQTMLLQVVAEALRVPVERVRVVLGDTDTADFDMGSAASRQTRVAGGAALDAAKGAHQVLARAAADLFECPEELLVWEPDVVSVSGQPSRQASFPEVAALACERYGTRSKLEEVAASVVRGDGHFEDMNYSKEPTFGVHIVELAVDPETGEVRVLRIVVAQDVGTIINPLLAEGQIQGGVIQSLGIALTEEIRMDGGRVVNPSLAEYKMATIDDVPPKLQVEFVEGAPGPGPFNAKGIGEVCIKPTCVAIANAISSALGIRVHSLPMRPEAIVGAPRQALVGS